MTAKFDDPKTKALLTSVFAPEWIVSEFIKRMRKSEANPSANISQDNTGSYTKEEANQWIKEYKEAMCKIPEYEEKLDCP